MKKKFKNLIIILLFIIITFFSFNYIVFGNLNLKNSFDIFYFLNDDDISSELYNKEYIDKNELVESTEENAIGTSVHTYKLEIHDVPTRVSLISFELDTNKVNSTNVAIYVYTSDGVFSYDEDDFYVDNKDEKIILIQQENVDKLIIKSIFEQYGSSSLANEEILSLNEIGINDKFDIEYVENNLLIDFFESFLITIIIFVIILILFKTNIDNKFFVNRWKIENVFLVLAITFGIVFSILFPLYQVPDELTHINMIYEELNLDMQFQDVSDYYGDTLRIMRNYDEKVDVDKYFDFSKKLEITDEFNVPSVKVVRHFPQTIGLIISSLLKLPVFVGITISELFAVLFYSIVCYVALKLLPLKKEAMMLIMLLPMCFQQMGSFSYDAVLLPLCFLFISYVLYLKFTKGKIKVFDIFIMLVLLMFIALIKLPYVMLGGMTLLLPISKLDLKIGKFKLAGNWILKNKKIILVTLGLVCIPVCYIAFKILMGMCYGRILIAAIKSNFATVNLLFNTISVYWKGYFSGLTGDFGWLDTPVSPIFTVFVMCSLLLVSFFNGNKTNKKLKFKRWECFYLLILGGFFCIIIILSMFEWTLRATGIPNYDTLSILEYETLIRNSIPVIGGVQARYFIPIIPLFILPLYSNIINKINNKMNCKFYLFIYYVIVISYMLFIILKRYWIG